MIFSHITVNPTVITHHCTDQWSFTFTNIMAFFVIVRSGRKQMPNDFFYAFIIKRNQFVAASYQMSNNNYGPAMKTVQNFNFKWNQMYGCINHKHSLISILMFTHVAQCQAKHAFIAVGGEIWLFVQLPVFNVMKKLPKWTSLNL